MFTTKKELINRIVINDTEDLKRKLKKRIKKIDSKETRMYTIEEAFKEINKEII